MPTLPFLQSSFQGGFNSKDAAYDLTPNEARDLSNVQGTTAGAIVKRNGLVTFASPASTLQSLYPFEVPASTVLIGTAGTSIYKVSTGGTVTAIKTGLSNGNARWEWVSAKPASSQGALFGMAGNSDTPQQWDGSAGTTSNWTNASGAVAVPNGKYVRYAENQVFVAGVPGNPYTVYWSAIDDPTNWDATSLTGAGSAELDPDDGQPITGLGIVGPYVLVTKARKLYVIVNTGQGSSPVPTIRRLSDSVGCVAHRSIASGSEGTYFLSEDRGVYLTNGSHLTPISDKIQPTIDAVGAQKSQAVGTYFNAHYYLSVAGAGSGSNDTTLDYDATLQSWWKHSFGSNQFAVWHPTGTAQLYSAKSTAAIVDQCFASGVTVDNGTAFKWVWRGPWISPSYYRRRFFPTPYYRKRLRQVRFEGSGTIDFSLATDFQPIEALKQTNLFQTGSTTWGQSGVSWGQSGKAWGDQPPVQRARWYSGPVANAFSFVFSATSTTADSVLSYTAMLTDRKDLVT